MLRTSDENGIVALDQVTVRVCLEYFTVVAGDLADKRLVVERMWSTRRRASFLPESERPWTVTPPPWWIPPPWLPARYSAAKRIDPGP